MRLTPCNTAMWCAATLAALTLGGPASAESSWARGLADQALREGADAKLPPHVSVVLGLTTREQSTAVKQIVDRAGHEVRTFNVCSTNHSKIVIFAVNEETQATTAYLLSSSGRLRKAVEYSTGAPARELSAAESRAGFSREVRYWSGRVRQ